MFRQINIKINKIPAPALYKINIRTFASTNTFPFKGLPFRLSLDNASKILLDSRNILEKRSKVNDLIIYEGNSIKEKFIPFYGANIRNLCSDYRASYGIDRTEVETYWEYDQTLKTDVCKTRLITVTDWYKTYGTIRKYNYPIGTTRTQIYAGFTYSRKDIENIMPKSEVSHMITLNANMLRSENGEKRIIDPHVMNSGHALEKIINRLHDMEQSRAKEYIRKHYSADHVIIDHLDMQLNHANIDLVNFHLPAFIYQFSSDELTLYKIIDGWNGGISGDKIYSPLKTFMATSLIGMIIAPLIGGPASTSILAGRIILGGLITGTPGGVWAKLSHIFKFKKAQEQM